MTVEKAAFKRPVIPSRDLDVISTTLGYATLLSVAASLLHDIAKPTWKTGNIIGLFCLRLTPCWIRPDSWGFA